MELSVPARPCAAFLGDRQIASGDLPAVALEVKRTTEAGDAGILVFDDRTGRVIDINIQGTDEDVLERLVPLPDPSRSIVPESPAGRGRPKLGVVGREVTLLPRHWEWLGKQPGGASVALRKLVEEARKANSDKDRARERRDAAYRFMSAMAGNRVGFEEASRALFAEDRLKFAELAAAWPADISNYLMRFVEEAK